MHRAQFIRSLNVANKESKQCREARALEKRKSAHKMRIQLPSFFRLIFCLETEFRLNGVLELNLFKESRRQKAQGRKCNENMPNSLKCTLVRLNKLSTRRLVKGVNVSSRCPLVCHSVL